MEGLKGVVGRGGVVMEGLKGVVRRGGVVMEGVKIYKETP